MNKNSDPRVPFTIEKITKCFCPQCPVQGNSQCVKDKMEKLPEIMCICGGCPIFEEYNLAGGKPMFYYCQDGITKVAW